MTERLRDGMREELKSNGHPWGTTMIVLSGTESRSTKDVVIPDGRTDVPLMILEVFFRTQEHEPHAIIECKRIVGSDTRLCREYVRNGVDRFRTGQYAKNHARGFMVGYTLAGTAVEAADGVNTYLTRQGRDMEHLIPNDLCGNVQNWTSEHARAIPSPPVRLYHVFFELAGVVPRAMNRDDQGVDE